MPAETDEKTDGKGRSVFARLFERTTTLGADIVFCIGITIACSMFSYESYIDESVMLPMRIFALLLMLFNWIWAAYSSGKKYRPAFEYFTLVYWIVPYAVSAICDFSESGDAAAVLFGTLGKILSVYPFSFLSGLLNIPEWFFCAIIVIAVTAVYIFSSRYYYGCGDDGEQ